MRPRMTLDGILFIVTNTLLLSKQVLNVHLRAVAQRRRHRKRVADTPLTLTGQVLELKQSKTMSNLNRMEDELQMKESI